MLEHRMILFLFPKQFTIELRLQDFFNSFPKNWDPSWSWGGGKWRRGKAINTGNTNTVITDIFDIEMPR